MNYDAIIQFNNVEKPYFIIKVFNDGQLAGNGALTIEPGAIQNGIFSCDSQLEKINTFLDGKQTKRSKLLFLINCEEVFKLATVLPNISGIPGNLYERRLRKMYDNEFANKVANIEKFNRATFQNAVAKGRAFYDFLVDKRFEEYAKDIATKLNFESCDVDFYHTFLFKKEVNTRKTNFVYFYEEKDVVSMLLVNKGQLISYTSFANVEEAYNLAICSYVDKHLNALEEVKDLEFVTSKEITCISKLNPVIEQYSIGN